MCSTISRSGRCTSCCTRAQWRCSLAASGTFDESFELLTLIQTGKIALIPVLFYGKHFWSRQVDFWAVGREGDLAQGSLTCSISARPRKKAGESSRDFWKGKDHTGDRPALVG